MAAFFNRATLNYGGGAIDSNTVRGELNAALAVNKAAIHANYRPGDTVGYAVTLTNSGAVEAAGLLLRDDLGAYVQGAQTRVPLEFVPGSLKYFIDGAPQPEPLADISDGALFIRDIRVPAGGDAAILYAARVNDFAPLGAGAAITNTVRLDDAASASTVVPANPNGASGNVGGASGNMGGANGSISGANAVPSTIPANPNGMPANSNGALITPAAAPSNVSASNSAGTAMAQAVALPQDSGASALPAFASAVILPEMAARLSLRKALSPESVSPGEQITYTLTIRNEGGVALDASEGATLSDVFNPRMNITSVRFNGAEWSAQANYSYDASSGSFATLPGQLTVPAASFSQDAATGRWQTLPGESTIEITGTLR